MGSEQYCDGSVYTGQFLRGCKHGVGSLISKSGKVVFEGELEHDKTHGEGEYHFPDGRKYTGQWQLGQMHGIGIMEWPDGSKYCGSMKDNQREGEGTLTRADGQVFEGQWYQGILQGFVI